MKLTQQLHRRICQFHEKMSQLMWKEEQQMTMNMQRMLMVDSMRSINTIKCINFSDQSKVKPIIKLWRPYTPPNLAKQKQRANLEKRDVAF